MEDEESTDRRHLIVIKGSSPSRIQECSVEEESSDESMPDDVSESDHYMTRNVVPSGSTVGPSSTGEVRSTSKLSTVSERHNMDIRNVKSKLENLVTEESLLDSLENLDDENEEMHQSIMPQQQLSMLDGSLQGGYNTNFLLGPSPAKDSARYSNPQQVWIYKTFSNEPSVAVLHHAKANSLAHNRHVSRQSLMMVVKPEAPKQFTFNYEGGRKCFRDRQREDITAQRHYKTASTYHPKQKEPQSTPNTAGSNKGVHVLQQTGKENATKPFEMVPSNKQPYQGK